MFGILQHVGPEVPFILLLLALLGLRMRVAPRVSVFIATSPEKLWALLNPVDGKTDHWGRTIVVAQLQDAQSQTFGMTYATTLPNGTVRTFHASFCVSERTDFRLVTMKRVGLGGRSLNNELLEIRHQLSPENGGTRVRTQYFWGPRPILAQVLARADLWGGAYRLKGLAETGIPNDHAFSLIGAGVGLLTGLLSLAAFGLMGGFNFALVMLLALFVHEFGHLLAFRLIGQPWGRMVFLPFLGAIAVPRLPFESQAQSVFSALMGPGFSCLLALACLLPSALKMPHAIVYAAIGAITCGLNAFNLLPAEPLDGGVALRSVLTRLIGSYAWAGLMGIGVIIVGIGYAMEQFALVLFGGMAVLANLKLRKIDPGLVPLTTLQVCIAFFAYVAIAATHYSLMMNFLEQLGL